MTKAENIYLNLKRRYTSVYNAIFIPLTLTIEFQKANSRKRLELIRHTRYNFLMELIARQTPNANDAALIIPLLCFNDHPISKIKNSFAETPTDDRKYIFNPWKDAQFN